MKNYKYIVTFILSALVLVGCQDEDQELGELIAPTNVQVTAEIVGQDTSNPFGDGSGLVKFVGSSDNALTYRYDFGDGSDVVSAPLGVVSHVFAKTGVNTYTVTVLASGTGGITTSMSMNIDVFSSFEDEEARDLLSGGAGLSKTWYWAADKPQNIGLGPNEVQAGGEHTFNAWFQSTAWHSDKLCMYDAEMVFSQSPDGDLTFEQIAGQAYLPGGFAGELGVAGDTCHGTDVVPSLVGVKNVQLVPSSSIATIDGGYRGTTISFTDGGFMSWYVGNSNFEIITITEDRLHVRVTEPGFAWYCVFQTDNPND
ncbi:PKD domain-containing protein [Algibacter sp. 2305UL17-15]|uniref:PKD domain-containing protein n=1 Tax=Algibacter sp. 2305UL17-15 TaxID=3231268 RepID=UPI00345751EE